MFQVRQKSSLILVASPSVSELELPTFVLFGVVSVGVVKNDWLLVIQLDAMTFQYWVMKILTIVVFPLTFP